MFSYKYKAKKTRQHEWEEATLWENGWKDGFCVHWL